MKLIYTERGLDLYNKNLKQEIVQNDPVPKSSKSSVVPQSIKIQALSRQNNQIRLSYLKSSCYRKNSRDIYQTPQQTSKEANISGIPIFIQQWPVPNFNSSSNLFAKKILSPERQQSPIATTNRNIKPLTSERMYSGTVDKTKLNLGVTTIDHSIKQHHVQSIRLKSGEWLQWKNIPMNQASLQLFDKTIQMKQKNQNEISSNLHRRTERNKESIEMYQEQERKKQNKIDGINEQRGLRYDITTDQFWQLFQNQKNLLQDHNVDLLKFQKRERKRLNEHNIKKYRQFVYAQPNQKQKEGGEYTLNKEGQLQPIYKIDELSTSKTDKS